MKYIILFIIAPIFIETTLACNMKDVAEMEKRTPKPIRYVFKQDGKFIIVDEARMRLRSKDLDLLSLSDISSTMLSLHSEKPSERLFAAFVLKQFLAQFKKEESFDIRLSTYPKTSNEFKKMIKDLKKIFVKKM